MKHIKDIYDQLHIPLDYLIGYGTHKAKIDLAVMHTLKDRPLGKLILVTAINPTPAGEGKTTTSIALAQGLKVVGKNPILALREPSLGPVFGLKGGATGGGLSSVVPESDINLHFTGDMHAITSANNLLSALIDNHVFHGNELNIKDVLWPRVMDINDRNLRTIQTKQREDGFIITAASEIMAIFAMSKDIFDLRDRINKILIGYNTCEHPLYVSDLGCADALVLLLKDAFNPNLVQSIEGVPTLIHAGPFANIAHGCNSVVATELALRLGDFVVTEAGFGADLGMEKFIHLKMPNLSKQADAVVIVVTLRALKLHGGSLNYHEKDVEALRKGIPNLEKHLENILRFQLPYVISVNEFNNDSKEEIEYIMNWAKENNHNIALSKGFSEGGLGSVDLANEVINLCEKARVFKPLYTNYEDITKNIQTIATLMYGAKGVSFSKKALKQLEMYQQIGYHLPICMAKTPMSLSGNPLLKGRPKDFTLEINQIRVSRGAGFIVCETKGIMVMPGLNKTPRALRFKLNNQGLIEEVDL